MKKSRSPVVAVYVAEKAAAGLVRPRSLSPPEPMSPVGRPGLSHCRPMTPPPTRAVMSEAEL
jgi:hypothetical protein